MDGSGPGSRVHAAAIATTATAAKSRRAAGAAPPRRRPGSLDIAPEYRKTGTASVPAAGRLAAMRSRTPTRFVAGALAVAALIAGCTGEPEPRRHGDSEACRFAVGRARAGDVPVAIDGTAPDDLWAVGAHYEGGAGVPYARRWDGETWRATPVQIVSDAIAGFHDVVAVSQDEAWAVGSMRGKEPMTERWDGTAWSDVPVPATGADEAELFAVTAPDDRPWAVGRARFGLRWHPLVMRWDGRAWVAERLRAPIGVDAALRDVDAAAPDDVWAVGWNVGPDGRFRTLALRSTGRRWRRVATPDPAVGDHVLSAVAAVGKEAWAVGWVTPDAGSDVPLVLLWAEATWRVIPVPSLGGRAQLTDVVAPASDDVWIAGRVTDGTQTFRSLILHWDGRRIREVATPDVGAEDDTLAGIAVVDGFPWAVGTSVDAEGRYTSLTLSGC